MLKWLNYRRELLINHYHITKELLNYLPKINNLGRDLTNIILDYSFPDKAKIEKKNDVFQPNIYVQVVID
jgi:hypothetical protein